VNSCTSCTYGSLVMAINTTMHVLTYFIINTAHVLPRSIGSASVELYLLGNGYSNDMCCISYSICIIAGIWGAVMSTDTFSFFVRDSYPSTKLSLFQDSSNLCSNCRLCSRD
jgi:hypothetical protein